MKVILKEEQQEKLKLPPFIYKAIANKTTSIGDNEALPPFGDFGFEYSVVKKGFEEADEIISKYVERGELESKDVNYLVSVLSEKIEKCKKIEKTLKPQLEKLCENIVNSYFSIPSDTINLKCTLVGEVTPKNTIRVLPESDNEGNIYDFEDADEAILTNKIILKRRFINCLIQGLSHWLSTDLDDWCDTVVEMNDEVWNLWFNIIHITNYLLYTKKDEVNEKHPDLLSYVEVKLGKKGRKTNIEAQGVIFPFLLRDTIRGLMELFSANGLPKDTRKAMYIIRKSDFLVAEPWDLRLGIGIIDVLQTSFKKYHAGLLFNTDKIPFFFSDLCKLDVEEFNSVMKNFLLGTRKGEIIAHEMDEIVSHNIDYQKFKDRIVQKNIKTSVINDGNFSKEELDGYVLQENETDEMMAYHGTSADFDKFNHKKFLNTGAGSQSFGWGTYVTNDEVVANGYSESSKRVPEYQFFDIFLKYLVDVKGMPNDFDTRRLADDYKSEFMKERAISGGYEELKDICEFYLQHPKHYNMNSEKAERYKMYVYVLSNIYKDNAFLYEVDIPEDNGENYLAWYEHCPKEFMYRIIKGFLRIPQRYLDAIAESNYPFKCDLYRSIQWMKANPERQEQMLQLLIKDENYHEFFSTGFYSDNPNTEGRNVYLRLCAIFGGKKNMKAASLFLMQCGFDGIKYPSGTMWKKPDGAAEDAYNYVIFDANKVKIVNKTKV